LNRYAGIQFDPQVVEAFGRTKTANAHTTGSDDEPGEPERTFVPVPTLGQVAAARSRGAMSASRASAES
jgi:hypothetical protein